MRGEGFGLGVTPVQQASTGSKPPTLLAGIWGMNFKVMPELGLAWGYPLALGAILLSALVPLGWFKWKGWV